MNNSKNPFRRNDKQNWVNINDANNFHNGSVS